MTKEDIKRKLCSRKFWMAVAGLVAGLIAFFKNPTTDANSITALIMALGSVVAYCVGEGLADAAGAQSVQTVTYLDGDDWAEPDDKPPEEG